MLKHSCITQKHKRKHFSLEENYLNKILKILRHLIGKQRVKNQSLINRSTQFEGGKKVKLHTRPQKKKSPRFVFT